MATAAANKDLGNLRRTLTRRRNVLQAHLDSRGLVLSEDQDEAYVQAFDVSRRKLEQDVAEIECAITQFGLVAIGTTSANVPRMPSEDEGTAEVISVSDSASSVAFVSSTSQPLFQPGPELVTIVRGPCCIRNINQIDNLHTVKIENLRSIFWSIKYTVTIRFIHVGIPEMISPRCSFGKSRW